MISFNSFNIKLFSFWHGTHDEGWVERNRRNYDYELVYFSNGSCKVITESQTFFCTDNTLLILPPWIIHSSRAHSIVSRYCVHIDFMGNSPPHPQHPHSYVYMDDPYPFDAKLTAAKVPEILLKFPLFVKFHEDDKEKIIELMNKFFSCNPDELSDHFIRTAAITELMGMAVKAFNMHNKNNVAPVNAIFAKAKNYFDSKYSDPGMEIKKCADYLKISPNHLNKLFKQHLNMTCSEYIALTRLNKAKNLLTVSSYNIQEIALICGFTDANYFTRVFRKKFNVSPTVFRKET